MGSDKETRKERVARGFPWTDTGKILSGGRAKGKKRQEYKGGTLS